MKCEWCDNKRTMLVVLRWDNGAQMNVRLCRECKAIADREGIRPTQKV